MSWEELAEIAADLRAIAEDARARGWRQEPPEVDLPAAVERPEPVEVVAPPPVPAPAAPSAPIAARDPWSKLAAEARSARDPALELSRIRADLGDCRRCALCKERKSIVFGVGDPAAHLVIVGEAPGQQEDVQGEPFVGAAGQMLDKMLEHVLGLTRDEVYILNVVKCRPPKNRNPEPEEIGACRPFLERQIDAIAPKVLLVLGSVAYKALFDTAEGITRNRGRWHEYQRIPTLPTFHPAYLLRTPADKRLTFDDLKVLRQKYDALGGKRARFGLT